MATGAAAHLEVVSWSVSFETDWLNAVPACTAFLPPCSNPWTDTVWIQFAESIGLTATANFRLNREVNVEDRFLDTTWTRHIVKVSGVFLLIGLGSWLCYKLLKIYRTTLKIGSDGSDESNQRSFDSLLKASYFGPAAEPPAPASTPGPTAGPDESSSPRFSHVRSILNMRPNHNGSKYDERSFTTSESTKGHRIRVTKHGSLYNLRSLSSDTSNTQTTSSSSSKSSPVCSAQLSLFSSPGLSKLSSDFDLLPCYRENSIDNISEISFDVESTSTTVAKLDRLQEEIDRIKNNCISMDEEFITIKCNRNMPGLSDLIESGEFNESLPTAEEIQSAKTCFKGLYSLTTINRSMSLDLTDVTVMSDCSAKVSRSAEEDALPSLEWDELEEPSVSLSSVSISSNRISTLGSSGVFSKPFDSLRSSQALSDVCISETTYIQRCTSFESESAMVISDFISESPSSASFSELLSPECEPSIENIGPEIDIVNYAATEWKGNTEKAETIRKGYCAIVNNLGGRRVRKIKAVDTWDKTQRGSAEIRAAVFQVLSQGLPVPSGAVVCQNLASTNWKSPPFYSDSVDDFPRSIEQCLTTFDQLVADLESSMERSGRLRQLLNADPLLDVHIVKAVRLCMLEQTFSSKRLNSGQDFSWHSSEMSCDFMNNCLSNVGDSDRFEMEEEEEEEKKEKFLSLLSSTLGVTLRVVRPLEYRSNQFVRLYPSCLDEESNKKPHVTLIIEDDQHYNLLVD